MTSNVELTPSPSYSKFPVCCNTNNHELDTLIGLIAVGIAIFAFIMQERGNRKIQRLIRTTTDYNEYHKKIEDSVRSDSLLAIMNYANNARQQIIQILRELEKQTSIEELNRLIYPVGFGKVLATNAESIHRHNGNLKFLIISSLHSQIERIGMRIKYLSDLDELSIRRIPDGHEQWINLAKETIQNIDELTIAIKDKLGFPQNSP